MFTGAAARRLLISITGSILVVGCAGSPFHRLGAESPPPGPPATVTWHKCPYRRLPDVETLASATAFEHQAAAYENLNLEQIGEVDGLPIYGLPLFLDNPYPCNGPWFIHLKVGPTSFGDTSGRAVPELPTGAPWRSDDRIPSMHNVRLVERDRQRRRICALGRLLVLVEGRGSSRRTRDR